MVRERLGMRWAGLMAASLLVVAGCARSLPPAPTVVGDAAAAAPDYVIGPLDDLQVFVWGADSLSTGAKVRPDGRITLPLAEDIQAAGKTPTQLAREVELVLVPFVRQPKVSVIVTDFGDAIGQTVRVVGEVQNSQAVPYRAGMTVLDVMVAVGGLGDFADGDRATLVRGRGTDQKLYGLRLDALMRSGDTATNSPVLPGDIILVPKSLI